MELENPTPETITTLVGTPGTGAFTYTNEAGAVVTLQRISADVGNTITPGTDGGAFSTGGGGAADKGISVFKPYDNEPSSTLFATGFVKNQRPTLDFNDTQQETAVFFGMIPRTYAGGNIIVDVLWDAKTAIAGTIGWDVTFERIVPGTTDADADSWATPQTITAATVDASSGVFSRTSVTITAGAAGTASVAAGDFYRLRVRRDVANDTAVGDAQLFGVEVREA